MKSLLPKNIQARILFHLFLSNSKKKESVETVLFVWQMEQQRQTIGQWLAQGHSLAFGSLHVDGIIQTSPIPCRYPLLQLP